MQIVLIFLVSVYSQAYKDRVVGHAYDEESKLLALALCDSDHHPTDPLEVAMIVADLGKRVIIENITLPGFTC